MHKNCIPKPNCLDMSQMTSSFGVSQMPGFVASFMVVLTYCGNRRGIVLGSLHLLLGEYPQVPKSYFTEGGHLGRQILYYEGIHGSSSPIL
jgi:hypothetical protein